MNQSLETIIYSFIKNESMIDFNQSIIDNNK